MMCRGEFFSALLLSLLSGVSTGDACSTPQGGLTPCFGMELVSSISKGLQDCSVGILLESFGCLSVLPKIAGLIVHAKPQCKINALRRLRLPYISTNGCFAVGGLVSLEVAAHCARYCSDPIFRVEDVCGRTCLAYSTGIRGLMACSYNDCRYAQFECYSLRTRLQFEKPCCGIHVAIDFALETVQCTV